MTKHALMALIHWLYERIAAEHPSAPRASCWPTHDVLTSAIQQNRKYFPRGAVSLAAQRVSLVGSGMIEVGPCPGAQPWHRCEHWALTEAGLAQLERMDREKCGRGVTKGRCVHRQLAGFEYREVA